MVSEECSQNLKPCKKKVPRNIMKLSMDLIVDRAPKDEVLFHLILVKMAELVDPIPSGDMVVNFNKKMMRTN